MSEYSQIQTYIKSNPGDFKDVIKQFAEVLNSLGLAGWSPEERTELTDTWLEVSLLFLTVEIENRMGQLIDEHKSFIWETMVKLSKEFTESGVYFTNEVTDGRPWEALMCGEKEGIWEFDAAIVPKSLFTKYKEYPTEMFININDNEIFVTRKSIWGTEPWLAID